MTTLQNAISSGRIGHAYLFTGPRGVGKTSMARIFAKALNCKEGPTVKPCGKCQNCQEIENARALDVLEIDGASNRGIDEIRALRENVKFAPAAGKFKIYIIDEVHQITTDGFNALLKTLEEPPAHVKFIFATTSSHKVPATILSRCQRFDFRRIPTNVIADTLKKIAKDEKIKIDDEALFLAAQAADGSLRDSQSILDQIASTSEGKVTKNDVTQSLGMLEEQRFVELVDSLAAQDAKAALILLDGVLKEGKDASIFMEKFLEHTRNLLFLSVSDDLLDLVEASDSHKKSLLKQKNVLTRDDLFYFSAVIVQTLQTMKRFDQKRIPLEIALVKLSRRSPLQDISKVLEELRDTQKKTPERPVRATPVAVSKPEVVETPKTVESKITAPVEEDDEDDSLEELVEDDIIAPVAKEVSLESVWAPLLRAVKAEKVSAASYLAEGELRNLKGGVVTLAFPTTQSFHREYLETDVNKKLIEKHLSALLGQSVRIEFQSVKELSGKPKENLENLTIPKDAEAQDKIKSAMNIFGGRVVG